MPVYRRDAVRACAAVDASSGALCESAEIRNTANIALFHERANELEAQLATGEIDEQQHQRLTTELERNLLADIGDADKEVHSPGTTRQWQQRCGEIQRRSFCIDLCGTGGIGIS